MNDYSNLGTNEAIEDDTDYLGGGGQVHATDVYEAVVNMAYMDKSASGAMSFNVEFKLKNGGTHKETMYVTSGTAKGCKNYYMERDRVTKAETGKKRYLPGFSMAHAICALGAKKGLMKLAAGASTRKVKVYNPAESKEMAMDKDVLVELIGCTVKLGLESQIVNKQVKNEQGIYVATAEIRKQNEIIKVFQQSTNRSYAEVIAKTKAEDAAFHDAWLEKNKGQVNDKTTIKAESAKTTTAGAGATEVADDDDDMFAD